MNKKYGVANETIFNKDEKNNFSNIQLFTFFLRSSYQFHK